MTQQQGKIIWESLGINSVDSISEQQQQQQVITKRVVLVGDALSGKRTFTSRLFAAAMQQFPSSTISSSLTNNNNNNNSGRTLSHLLRRESSDLNTSVDGINSARSQQGNNNNNTQNLAYFPHGAGISQAFILQRIPANRNILFASTEDSISNNNSSSAYMNNNNSVNSSRSSSVIGMIPTTTTTTTTTTSNNSNNSGKRVMTEFFCCDAPGALLMALPTLESLETSIILIIINTSEPWRVRDQVRRWYGYLNSHVIQILRLELPKQDEVRRMKMIEQQQRFWQMQQQLLGNIRRRWIEREGICQERNSNEFISLPIINSLKGGITPLRTILVCSKTDQLERLSRDVEKLFRTSTPSNNNNNNSDNNNNNSDNNNNNLSVNINNSSLLTSTNLRSAMRTTGLSLLELISQLLRREAIEHQSSLVGVGSRVNTTATSSTSPPPPQLQTQNINGGIISSTNTNATFSMSGRVHHEVTSPLGIPNTFVHPFYKNLWSYIFQLLHDPALINGGSGSSRSGSITPEVIISRNNEDGNNESIISGNERSLEGSILRNDTYSHQIPRGTPLVNEMETQISAKFHPHAFLPHGVDHLELLSPFITSTDAVTLEGLFTTSSVNSNSSNNNNNNNNNNNGPATTTTTTNIGGIDNNNNNNNNNNSAIQLHDKYMQQIESILANTGPEDEAMIWDKL